MPGRCLALAGTSSFLIIVVLTLHDHFHHCIVRGCVTITGMLCHIIRTSSGVAAVVTDRYCCWFCSLDTGRLNPETYQLFAAVEKHYGIRIEYTFPDAQECMDLVRAKGMFSFYEDGHQECCRVRKVLAPASSSSSSPLHVPHTCSVAHQPSTGQQAAAAPDFSCASTAKWASRCRCLVFACHCSTHC